MAVRINLLVAIVLSFVLIGCGGGETTTTGLSGDTGTTTPAPSSPTPAPSSPAPAPDPGDFNGTGTAALSWMAPTTYTDNTSFTDLQGHNIYMDSGNGFVKIGTVASAFDFTYQVDSLSVGTYTFAVTAFDAQGIESSYSQTASVTITS